MSARFSFELRDDGWALCGIEVDAARFEWIATRLSPDPFAATLEAFAEVLRGCPDARIEYLDPPQCRALSLLPRDGGMVHLSMHRHEDWFRQDNRTAELEFETVARLRTLAGSVLAAAQAILQTEGEANFQAKWSRPFPHDAMARLQLELENKR